MSKEVEKEDILLFTGVSLFCLGFLIWLMNVNPPHWKTYFLDIFFLGLGLIMATVGYMMKYKKAKSQQKLTEYT